MFSFVIPVVIAGVVFALVQQRRTVRRLENIRAAEWGDGSLEFPAKLRLLDAKGWRGRWREVVIRRDDAGRVTANPYRPRRAASFVLTGTRAVGIRPARPFERWWFAGRDVVQCDGDLGGVELGFGTAAEAASAARVLAHDPGDGCRS